MADKTKTIKGATDKELDDLIGRIAKELQLQSMISEINRRSSSVTVPYDAPQKISTEVPIESLYHVGILGMRWGHRKASSSGGSRSSGSSKPKVKTDDDDGDGSDDHKKVNELKKKKPSQLSNTEMQAVITRVQLEKQFAEANKKKVSAGQKFVTELLVNAGKQEAQKLVNDYASKGSTLLQDIIKKKLT